MRAPWIEVRSPHFRVLGNLPPERAERFARELEAIEAAALAVDGARRPEQIPPLEVVFFEDDRELDQWRGARAGRGAKVGETLLVASAERSPGEDSSLKHAISHRCDGLIFPRLPRWVAEALATRVETASIAGSEVVVGARNANRANYLWSHPEQSSAILRLPEERVRTLDAAKYDAYVSMAWLLGQTLAGESPEVWKRLLGRLRQGEEPDLDLAEVSHDLRDRPGRPAIRLQRVPLPELSLQITPLDAAFVHALRASISPGRARAELDAALAIDPLAPSALALRPTLDAARQGAARAPNDAAAWFALARAAHGPEREGALRMAVSLDRGNPAALRTLAEQHLETHVSDARTLAGEAVTHEPDATDLALYARTLCADGKRERAERAFDAAESRQREGAAPLGAGLPAVCESTSTADDVLWIPREPPSPVSCRESRPRAGSGLVLADYVIDEQGAVQAFTALSGAPAAAEAVRAYLASCTFPPSRETVRVTQPYVFGSQPQPAPSFARVDPFPRLAVTAAGGYLLSLDGGASGPFGGLKVAWNTPYLSDALIIEGELSETQFDLQDVAGSQPFRLQRTELDAWATARLRRSLGLRVEGDIFAGASFSFASNHLTAQGTDARADDRLPGAHAGAGLEYQLDAVSLTCELRYVARRMTIAGDPSLRHFASLSLGLRLWF